MSYELVNKGVFFYLEAKEAKEDYFRYSTLDKEEDMIFEHFDDDRQGRRDGL